MEKKDLLSELLGLRRRMNSLFEEALNRSDAGEEDPRFIPPVDIFEDGDGIFIRVELPGMAMEDIRLDAAGETLTISGTKRAVREDPDRTYHRLESLRGEFHREFALPKGMDTGKMTAEINDGVLVIVLPRVEPGI